jgi:hypothetical protein
MKNFVLKLTGLGLVMVALFFSSCGEDPIVVDPLGPEISFVADPGFLSADSEVMLGESFSVKVRLSKGDAQLNTLSINEGSDKLATSRYTINSGAVTSNNPLLIVGADKDGVTYSIDIAPSATAAIGDFITYSFTVADESNNTDLVDIVINITGPLTTPLTSTIPGVLFNQAGPAGTGGLDLDTGTGTGSAAAESEIRDLGLDCTMAAGTLNWLRQIGTINGAIMVRVDATQLENFTFDGVDNKEIVKDAYDTGIALSAGTSTNCASGATTTVQNTADVAVGDVFAVFANSKYYLFQVDDIIENTTGNGDSYELTIKF